MAKKYYAVKKGRNTGIFDSWDKCKQSVQGFSNSLYKSFSNYEDAYEFIYDKNEKSENKEPDVFAYIDGSYDDSQKRFSYAGIIFNNGTKFEFSNSSSDEEEIALRNVAGELHAAMYVMKYAQENKLKDITIYYDYAGIEMWATDKWKTNLNFTKQYAMYAKEIMKEVRISFKKVKAHSGVKYNEEVDKLAKRALYNGINLDGKQESYCESLQSSINNSTIFSNIDGNKSSAKINILVDGKIITSEELLTVIKRKWKAKKRTIKEINNIKSYYDVSEKKFVIMIISDNSEDLIIIESSEFNG